MAGLAIQMSGAGIVAAAGVEAVTLQDHEAFQLSEADALRVRTTLDHEYAVVWRSLRRFGVEPALVDDATQNVFLTFTRRIRDVEPGRERAFLIGVCSRVASNVRRLTARRREVSDEPLEDEPDATGTPEELLESKRRRRLLDHALDQLPADQRTVFVLYELEGWSLPEVAASLQIPLGTATSRLRRARARFEVWVAAQRNAGGAL